MYPHFIFTEPGITFATTVHPVCLPIESNANPEKWDERKVEVLGFSTKDKAQNVRGDRLKIAEMTAFSHTKCNAKLEKELQLVKNCKLCIRLIHLQHLEISR